MKVLPEPDTVRELASERFYEGSVRTSTALANVRSGEKVKTRELRPPHELLSCAEHVRSTIVISFPLLARFPGQEKLFGNTCGVFELRFSPRVWRKKMTLTFNSTGC